MDNISNTLQNSEKLCEKIGFLVWYQIFDHMDATQQNSIVHILDKISKYIEDEINSNKGIAKKKIRVHFLTVPEKSEDAVKKLENYLNDNPEIIFICQAPNFYSEKNEILQRFDHKSYIVFDAFDMFDDLRKNFFSTSKSFVKKNNMPRMLRMIDGLVAPKNIFYFTLEKDDSIAIHKDMKSNLIVTDLNEYETKELSDDDEKKFNLIDKFNSFSDDDVITFSGISSKEKINCILEYIESKTKAKLILSRIDPREVKVLINEGFKKLDEKDILYFDAENYHIYLKLKELFYSMDIKISNLDQTYINWFFGIELEIPYLIEYISNKNNFKAFDDKFDFINSCIKSLNLISIKNDVFLGKSCNYSFFNNLNILKNDSLLKIKHNSGTDETLFFLYENQWKNYNNNHKIVNVNYVNIDIVRMYNVSLANNEFSCEFFFDITSKNKDPIETIKFNNLSSKNSYFEHIQTNMTPSSDNGYSTYRYLIRANLSFNGVAERYPFDEQIIFISFAMINENKFGILQPFQDNEVDKDFVIDGWRLIESRFGVLRIKNRINRGPNELPKMEVEEELRMGWRIKRSNTMTMIKVGIPLIFLTSLVYYTLFIPYENIDRSIGILTTSFLSGIALYFSSEKPNPLKMTIIDYVFATYYTIVGLTTLGVIAFGFLPEFYYTYLLVAKTTIPLMIIILIIMIVYNIRNQKNLLKMIPKKLFE